MLVIVARCAGGAALAALLAGAAERGATQLSRGVVPVTQTHTQVTTQAGSVGGGLERGDRQASGLRQAPRWPVAQPASPRGRGAATPAAARETAQPFHALHKEQWHQNPVAARETGRAYRDEQDPENTQLARAYAELVRSSTADGRAQPAGSREQADTAGGDSSSALRLVSSPGRAGGEPAVGSSQQQDEMPLAPSDIDDAGDLDDGGEEWFSDVEGGASSDDDADEVRVAPGHKLVRRVCRVTAYCDRGTTASGVQSGVGQCAAPADIPFGTRVYIPELGRWFVVTDRTHKRFRKNTVDLFMPSRSKCLNFGRNYLECKFVIPPAGSRRVMLD